MVSDSQCREAYGESEVTDSMLCAGYPNGGQDACQVKINSWIIIENQISYIETMTIGEGKFNSYLHNKIVKGLLEGA